MIVHGSIRKLKVGPFPPGPPEPRTEGTGIQCVVAAFIFKNRIIIKVLKMELIGTLKQLSTLITEGRFG